MKIIRQQLRKLSVQLKPYLVQAENKFRALSYREKVIIIIGLVIIMLYLLFSGVSIIVKYRYNLQNKVNNLNSISASVDQIANRYKLLKNIHPNATNKIDINNLKQEVKTSLQTDRVDIDVQDNQIIISSSMVAFEKVVLLLEQLKKSYNVFPEKASFVKTKSGMVTFSFTIWMN